MAPLVGDFLAAIRAHREDVSVVEDGDNISVGSEAGFFLFRESLDHLSNALLRLMPIPKLLGRFVAEWVSSPQAPREPGDADAIVGKLATLWRTIDGDAGPAVPGRLIPAAGLQGFGLNFEHGNEHARLWDISRNENAKLDPSIYTADYFEGAIGGTGYGDFSQQVWRTEKANRVARQLDALTRYHGHNLKRPKVLDIGCGYGDLLAAGREAFGWRGTGLDVSEHAIERMETLHGIPGFVGSLDAIHDTLAKFDIIIMNDFIEHVEEPLAAIEQSANLLGFRGLIIIRTPNIQSAEFSVFGTRFHSVKREHLQYFSPTSILRMLEEGNFLPLHLETTSHLLQGWLGIEGCANLAKRLRGSDLTVLARKK